MIDFADALRRFKAGDTSIIETKAQMLRGFPGTRPANEAMLLADYIEEVAFAVRNGNTSIPKAVVDLYQVRESTATRH